MDEIGEMTTLTETYSFDCIQMEIHKLQIISYLS